MTPHHDVYRCPIDERPWQHTATPIEIPEGATPDDLAAIGTAYTSDIQQAMEAHFDDHSIREWATQVARLRQQLVDRPQLLCFGCYVDRAIAQQSGRPIPPQNMVQLIVNGDGRCLQHVKLQNGPVLPDRSAGGIILPGAPGQN